MYCMELSSYCTDEHRVRYFSPLPSVATCVVAKIYRPIFFIYVFSYKLCVNFTRLCGVGAIYQAAGGGGRQRLTYANQEPTERGNALLPLCSAHALPGRCPACPPGPRTLAPSANGTSFGDMETLQVTHKLFITGTDRKHASVMDSHGHPRGHRAATNEAVDC